jgi:hypothetical protein
VVLTNPLVVLVTTAFDYRYRSKIVLTIDIGQNHYWPIFAVKRGFDHRHRAKPLLTDFCSQTWFRPAMNYDCNLTKRLNTGLRCQLWIGGWTRIINWTSQGYMCSPRAALDSIHRSLIPYSWRNKHVPAPSARALFLLFTKAFAIGKSDLLAS